jgi:hypothetical protein
MNNNNRSADNISDELKFQPGAIYNSKVEMYADMRAPHYRQDGPEGDLYRARVNQKQEDRTLCWQAIRELGSRKKSLTSFEHLASGAAALKM